MINILTGVLSFLSDMSSSVNVHDNIAYWVESIPDDST